MEVLLLVIVLGAAAYLFFKSNTKRGIETVRAAIFLSGMEAGVTVAEANHVASIDIANGPPATIRGAMAFLQEKYGGKQLAMIGDAYRQGMLPMLPFWYRVVADLRTDNATSRHTQPVQPLNKGPHAEGKQPDYDDYENAVVAEAKRLDGKAATDLHWIELIDHEGTRRAYDDNVDPKELAAAILKIGMPSPV